MSTAIAAKLQQGLAHHQRGQLAQAESIYREILALAPMHFDALHFLGIVQYQNGRLEAAQELIQKAVRIDPQQAAAYSNLGLVLQALGKADEAFASFEHAARLQPGDAAASFNCGNALLQLGRYAEAVDRYDRAVALRPDYVEAHYNRGNVLAQLQRHDEALASYDAALALRPDDPLALYNRGNVLRALNRNKEALASFDAAIAQRADYVDALRNRGNTLRDLDRPEEALVSYERVLAIEPDSAQALTDCGNALLRLDRPEEALASYDSALALAQPDTGALNNRGKALLDLHRHAEALANYHRMLELDPACAAAHYNESQCRLLLGDFAIGWRKYEWRWKDEQFAPHKRDFKKSLWLGEEPLAGKTVLLHAEQGLGDTIQFCRYAKQVAAQGAAVLMEVQPPLVPLLEQLDGVHWLLGRGEALPAFDYHCPLLSLPLALRTSLDGIPADVPYLRSEPARVRRWRDRLGEPRLQRVGIVWCGNRAHRNDRNRSIPLPELLGLINGQTELVSLQKELDAEDERLIGEHPAIRHFGEDLVDFAETAALVELMDVVVTVDTAVAHLAGAMGKPVWILLPFSPDWRWLLNRDDSPWYPTATLFRQQARGDWATVLKRVAHALQRRDGHS